MSYLPHYNHDIRCGRGDEAAQALAKAYRKGGKPALVQALQQAVQAAEKRDTEGAAAFKHVHKVFSDPRFAGKPLSSVKARILKELGAGWTVRCLVDLYLVTPEGHTMFGTSSCDVAELERANTCWTTGAAERLAQYPEDLAKADKVADAMILYIEAAQGLAAVCGDTAALHFDPMTAAALVVSA